MSETDLVRGCLEVLNMHGIMAWRNNTGALRTGKRFIRFGAAGSPDIIAIRDGRFIGIECKLPGRKQSTSQIMFETGIRAAGGEYWLIYGVDELAERLVERGDG